MFVSLSSFFVIALYVLVGTLDGMEIYISVMYTGNIFGKIIFPQYIDLKT